MYDQRSQWPFILGWLHLSDNTQTGLEFRSVWNIFKLYALRKSFKPVYLTGLRQLVAFSHFHYISIFFKPFWFFFYRLRVFVFFLLISRPEGTFISVDTYSCFIEFIRKLKLIQTGFLIRFQKWKFKPIWKSTKKIEKMRIIYKSSWWYPRGFTNTKRLNMHNRR